MTPRSVLRFFVAATLACAAVPSAHAARVLLVSIDGLRPAELARSAKELPLPNLRRLQAAGAHANGVRDIAPTLAKLLGVSLPDAEGKPLF